MKKLLAVLLAAVMCFLFCACGNNNNNDEIDVEKLPALKIGISAGEDAPQMFVFDTMHSRIAKKGYRMEFVEFNTAQEANDALVAKEIDISLINQKWEFAGFEEENPDVLLNLGAVYYAPYGLYLCNFESVDKITDGAKVAVPSDEEGMARSLLLLENLGYIEVDDAVGIFATLDDVTANSRNFEFVAQSPDEIASNIETGEADMVVMSAESAKAADYKVNKYAVAIENYTDEAAKYYSTVMLINKSDISGEKYNAVSPLYFSHMMYENVDSYPGSYIVPSFAVNVKG